MDNIEQIIQELERIYAGVIKAGTFEAYEACEKEMESLFTQLQARLLDGTPYRNELQNLYLLHDQMKSIILQEYRQLKAEKRLADMKKSASRLYNNSYENDSYFFDQKR